MKRRDNPNRIPVSTETANEDAKTTKLIRNSIWLLIALGGRSVTSALVPQNASSTPKIPPLTDKSTLSVRSCFTRSQRLAPTESRTQISLVRAPPRAKQVGHVAASDQKKKAYRREEHINSHPDPRPDPIAEKSQPHGKALRRETLRACFGERSQNLAQVG